jgi:hypothetical protein
LNFDEAQTVALSVLDSIEQQSVTSSDP